MLSQPAEAVAATMFFIGPGCKYQAVCQIRSVPFQEAHCHHVSRQKSLAIRCPSTINTVIGQRGTERGFDPLWGLIPQAIKADQTNP